MNDLEVRLRGFDPPVRPPALGESDVSYTVMDAPVGPLVLAATEAGLVACSYDDEAAVCERLARSVSPRVLRSGSSGGSGGSGGSRGRLDAPRRELDAYFAGSLRAFGIPVDLRLAGPFGRSVLAALAAVPYGETTTYGALARTIGHPGAARAVGHALGANPVCVVVPCHRVVGADGRLNGYAGGVAAKRLLLDLEAGRPTA